jgi:hypothetical protein
MDHTSDPGAARYAPDAARTALAREFRANIRGPYSKPLQQLVHRMRWGAWQGRYVLLVLEPGRRWGLARMPAERGQPVEVFPDCVFDSLEEAEWHVFQLRWQLITGRPLELQDEAAS